MLIPSRAYCFCTPAVGLRAELEKKAVVDHTSDEIEPTADARRTAIVHTHVDSRRPVRPNFFA